MLNKALMKVVHEHIGYSGVLVPANGEGVLYELLLRRERRCDESLGDYVKSSPKMRVAEGSSDRRSSDVPSVIYLNGFVPSLVAGHERINCYLLRSVAVAASGR